MSCRKNKEVANGICFMFGLLFDLIVLTCASIKDLRSS